MRWRAREVGRKRDQREWRYEKRGGRETEGNGGEGDIRRGRMRPGGEGDTGRETER